MRDGESEDPSTESGGEPAVTEERRRTRHRDSQGRRADAHQSGAEGMDPERLRYFTQPGEGASHTRHRRRRAAPPAQPGEPTPPAQSGRPGGIPGRAQPVRIPPGGQPPQPPRAQQAPPPPAPPRRPPPPPVAPPQEAADTEFRPGREAEPEYVEPRYDDHEFSDVDAQPAYDEPTYDEPAYGEPAHTEPVATTPRGPRARDEDDWWPGADDPEPAAAPRRPRRRNRENQKKRRVVLALAIVFMLALVGGVGYYGLRSMGVLESRKDYTNTAGASDVIVDIPENSTLSDFGRILVDADVVGSVRAFIDAAGGQPMSGGLYKMRTQIPASTAVEMLTDDSAQHRVGRVVIPPGLQLDSKTGIDGKITPGIFQLIQDATATEVNGQPEGVTVAQLEEAAATSTPEALGVPDWAKENVASMTGDHRRVEGLIAPTTWERVEPDHTAVQILNEMISKSAVMFDQWGLVDNNKSGLSPYETLIAASIVEREVRHVEDAPKVARVIRNRLDEDQRLEMDSTQNYTAAVTNIDVHGEAYKADNEWNTYRYKGLPPTPIAAVGVPALEAMLDPAPGSWLYFVTVDTAGTTLFANTFEEHKRNRTVACKNKLVSTGCQ
ncbi:endolytic transglycosylase MltG [Gordonia alkanivorans]|uniref:endolytic transglycosylase MltG n=2 Tax=Gordonia alkanivorans TaxID=84096 RepID=UPI00244AAF96|nr:endolytic transglycosylase MltG [Gordonia alkanivorans]MDH3014311.1 endolytic transglycosylase MltG [Gordonia alkanivorans]MDH3041288.1 endolytic transglycosylase MltG [Gordonia alkanivorans]